MILKQLIKRTTNNTNEGTLCVAESCTPEIPFEIKRVYYTCDVKSGITRGHHAHRKLEQILICPHGKIEITLDYGNNYTESVILDDPAKGLYVGPSTWRTMEWLQDDSVLLVLASEHYDENDYIRNYDDFIKWIHQGENNADTI